MQHRIKIGTRGSKLALWQAQYVREALKYHDISAELVIYKTEGDLDRERPLYDTGKTALFTSVLDDAVINGEVDLAVHSAKDIPTTLPEGIEIVAFCEREDPKDVLLAVNEEARLDNLKQKWVIGTSSMRRKAFLKYYAPSVEVKNIRGNLDTRLKKLQDGEYDAIMLAYAGVKRMNMQEFVTQKFNVNSITPAVGQGAVAITMLQGHKNKEIVRQLNHTNTELAVRCERAFLRTIQGGCHLPVFGLATITVSKIALQAGLAAEDGSVIWRETVMGDLSEGNEIGTQAAINVLKRKNN